MSLRRFLAASTSALHPSDDHLLELALLGHERVSSTRAERTSRHLDRCPACTHRLWALTEHLEDMNAQVARALDGMVSDGRLAEQRRQIARRIERTPEGARVLPFPRHFAHRVVRGGASRRWIAAAAAAGLLVGVVTGRWMGGPPDRGVSSRSARSYQSAADLRGPRSLQASLGPAGDEALLDEIDLAVSERQPGPLAVLDALTPQMHEVALRVP